MKKRNLSFILLLSLLLSSTGCAGDGGSAVDSSGDTTGDDIATDETTVAEKQPPFEQCDYNGEEFHILAYDGSLYPLYFFADEYNGETLNDKLYERMMLVEDYLGIDVTYSLDAKYQTVLNIMTESAMAGDDEYQLVLTHCIEKLADTIGLGILYDWNELEYCNLSREYWNQSALEQLTVRGKTYYAISDFMLADPNAVLFNKTMIGNYSLENPYDIVRSGKWTIDKLSEMAKEVAGEVDGNDHLDENDRYGLACHDNWIWNSMLYSAGINLVKTDNDGNFVLNVNSERMFTLVEKLNTLINRTNDAYIWSLADPVELQLGITSDRVLFEPYPLRDLHLLRDSEVDYGIIPFPKLDEDQENYETNDWSGLMCVPKAIENPELVGKACELLAFYSADTVIPAYYDELLGEKLARDEDSKEMLEIIYDNIVYDAGFNYLGFKPNMLKLFYVIGEGIIKSGTDNFASWYATYGPGAQAELDAFIESLEE